MLNHWHQYQVWHYPRSGLTSMTRSRNTFENEFGIRHQKYLPLMFEGKFYMNLFLK